MATKWAQGLVGYEEILLPTVCLNTTTCKLSQFSGWDSVAANHVKYRVMDPSPSGVPGPRYWECSEYMQARSTKGGTLDLWHPVKDKSCLFAKTGLEQSSINHGRQECSCAADGIADATDDVALRSLRRRSVAWAARWREREERERPFVAAQKASEAQARMVAMKSNSTTSSRAR